MAKKTKSFSHIEAQDALERLNETKPTGEELAYDLLRIFCGYGDGNPLFGNPASDGSLRRKVRVCRNLCSGGRICSKSRTLTGKCGSIGIRVVHPGVLEALGFWGSGGRGFCAG